MSDETTKKDEKLEVEKPPEKKDSWTKAQILLPLAITLFGAVFTFVQSQQAAATLKLEKDKAEARLKADRLTTMLEHLGSADERKRNLARKVVEHFAKNDQISPEIIPALVETNEKQVENKTDEEIQSSTDSLATVATKSRPGSDAEKIATESLVDLNNNPNRRVALASTKSLSKVEITKVEIDSINKLPARVYLQIQKDTNRELANNLQTQLKANNLVAPGIEGVKKAPDVTEIRYFKSAFSAADLEQIKKSLTALKITDFKIDELSNDYPDSKVRPRHYEIWLGTNTNK